MNANTRLRLWKEARALLPTWVVMMALTVGSGWIGVTYENHTALNCFLLAGIGGSWLLGAVSVGHEFDHRTLGLLLGQPICRSRLWAEKMLVLSVAVGTLWWLAPVISFTGGHLVPSMDSIFSLASVLAIAICVAPALTLLARSTIGGAALTLASPFILLLAVMVVSLLVTRYRVENNLVELTDSKVMVIDHTPILAALLVAYCGSLAWFGWRKFVRWEENQNVPSQITLPASLTWLADGLRGSVSLGSHSAWGSLVRKELGLQQAAFLVALGLIALWLALVVAVTLESPRGREILLLPVVLLALGIPVIVGIVSTAEERSLGVHEWHLTLPVSARRQWCVKVIVALAVNALLGLVLPGLLAHASSWLANNPQLVAEIPGRNVPAFLIANAVIFCAALYASTASANSMRALIGTIGLFLAGAMVMNFADYIAGSYPKATYYSGGVRSGYDLPPEFLRPIHYNRWFLGWSCLAIWLYFLGLMGFRRSLESFWQPVRRMAVFFAVVCAFVFAAIVW